jgi:hypothetical protein
MTRGIFACKKENPSEGALIGSRGVEKVTGG